MKKPFLIGIAAVALGAGATALALETTDAAIYLPPRGDVPAASASVSVVARTYLEAAEHNDCGLTRALTDARSGMAPWCRHPHVVSFHNLETPISSPATESSGNEAESVVHFHFVIAGGADAGFSSNADQVWGLWFRHTPAGWRVWDQGVA